MRMGEVFQQLQKRRVIRAAVIYVALLWVVLQAADVFAEADIISGGVVRWLIIAGVAGLPLVLAGSWFLESPWKQRRTQSFAARQSSQRAKGLRKLSRISQRFRFGISGE